MSVAGAVTSSAAGGITHRRSLAAACAESVRRLAWRLETRNGLAAMFAIALAIRLGIAPFAGYYADLKIFQHWAARLNDSGLHTFYTEDWADYPPGYLYVLWLLGKVSNPPGFFLLKLPAIIGDLVLAWLAAVFAKRIAPPSISDRVPVRALVAAAVLFNPAVILLSAVWGQVDVVPACLVLSSFLLLYTGTNRFATELVAFLVFALAISMKPQAGFALPVMLYALYRRHFRHQDFAGVVRASAHTAALAIPSIGLVLLSAVPFGLGPSGLLHFYSKSASTYPFTSANAFNLWGVVGFWRRDSPGHGDFVAVAGISAVHLGMGAFLLGVVVVLLRAARALQKGYLESLVLPAASAAVSLLAFALLTRMHERYMFYGLAFLAPLLFVPALRAAYAALSALYALNLWWVYAYNNSRGDLGRGCSLPDPGCLGTDWIFGGFAEDAWQKKLASAAVLGITLAVAWFGAYWAGRAGRVDPKRRVTDAAAPPGPPPRHAPQPQTTGR
jgi:dolichyl-phosphate-mannose-protein mannosyltransferase